MTITSSGTFTVVDADPITVVADLTILPPVGAGTGGYGRLVHPVLGTYDYYKRPDNVVNMDGDVIFAPVWAHSLTLGGGADALWSGYNRDVIVQELWDEGDAVSLDHVRMLQYYRQNPPDPASNSFIQWYPNYLNAHRYDVAIVGLTVGKNANEYSFDTVIWDQGYVLTPCALQLRVIRRVS